MRSNLRETSVSALKTSLVGLVMCLISALAPAQEEAITPDDVEIDRTGVIATIMAAWAPAHPTGASQLQINLELASNAQLAAIANASSRETAHTILRGSPPAATGELAPPASIVGGPLALPPNSYYAAVEPCRIVDTRFAQASFEGHFPPPDLRIPSNEKESFWVYGAMETTGGEADCPSPGGEPVAVQINITVVPKIAGKGNARVYPYGSALPETSLVNYQFGTNIANAAIVKMAPDIFFDDPDIEVYVTKAAHVVIDVMGFFYNSSAPEDVQVLNKNTIYVRSSRRTGCKAGFNCPVHAFCDDTSDIPISGSCSIDCGSNGMACLKGNPWIHTGTAIWNNTNYGRQDCITVNDGTSPLPVAVESVVNCLPVP